MKICVFFSYSIGPKEGTIINFLLTFALNANKIGNVK